MKKILICLFCFLGILNITAQSPTLNLQKYWKYRERLKNFVVVGSGIGHGLPAPKRDQTAIEYSDETIILGYYIGFLATEYKLLKDHNEQVMLNNTKKELFYALEAFNRLDISAEHYWRIANGNVSSEIHPEDLNGFFIRDDVPSYFFEMYSEDGNLIENHLSNGLVPLENIENYSVGYNLDNFESDFVKSGFVEGNAGGYSVYNATPCPASPYKGPREESLDQANQLMLGLALVVKCVDPSDSYNNQPFLYESTPVYNFVQEAKRISERMVSWISNHNWTIVNPVVPDCVQGVYDCRSCGFGAPGGGNVSSLALGFSSADCAIQNDFANLNCDFTSNPFGYHYVKPIDRGTFNLAKTISMNTEDEKFLNLAAISNIWGTSDTQDEINDRLYGDPIHREHVSLLHNILWGGSYTGPFFECLLNSAPMVDINLHNSNFEWSGPDRLNSGPNPGLVSYSDEKSGLDYLLYFNLYCIANSSYMSPYYHYLEPKQLAVYDLVKTGNPAANTNNNVDGESDEKNFIAAHSITAGNINNKGDYDILNDLNYISTNPHSAAQVSFVSGNEISLLPGFSVHLQANFEAKIDQNIQPTLVSSDPPSQDCSGFHKKSMMLTTEEADETLVQTVQIIPNPNNGTFSLVIPKEFHDQKIGVEIIQSSGESVFRQERSGADRIHFSLLNLQNGVYILKINCNTTIFYKKMVITN